MIIKNIYIEKSRTFEVAGIMGRAKYVKTVVGLTGEYYEEDYPLGVEGEYKKHYKELSDKVDAAIADDIKKLRCKK